MHLLSISVIYAAMLFAPCVLFLRPDKIDG
jgi:hypothetical protein